MAVETVSGLRRTVSSNRRAFVLLIRFLGSLFGLFFRLRFLVRDHGWKFFAFRNELDRDAVDAVARIFLGHLLAVEDVSEVTAAVLAHDFDSRAVGVYFASNRIFDFVVEGWPAAAAVEFIVGFVEGGVASFANVGAFDKMVRIFTGESVFGSFVEEYPAFFSGEFVVFWFVHFLSFRGVVGRFRAATYDDFGCFFAFIVVFVLRLSGSLFRWLLSRWGWGGERIGIEGNDGYGCDR